MKTFKLGTILRYASGSTALFRVDKIYDKGSGGERYYGEHCMGGLHGAFNGQCSKASAEDLITWEFHQSGRGRGYARPMIEGDL